MKHKTTLGLGIMCASMVHDRILLFQAGLSSGVMIWILAGLGMILVFSHHMIMVQTEALKDCAENAFKHYELTIKALETQVQEIRAQCLPES